MTYSEKIKASKELYNAITALQDNEVMEVTYGKDFRGNDKTYTIRAYNDHKDEMSYSIWNGINGMNVGKLSKTSMHCYTYDMMSQRTTYVFPLYEMSTGFTINNNK